MSLFEIKGKFLQPRPASDIKKCIALAETIPGADVDDGGCVSGNSDHAIAAVAKLDGLRPNRFNTIAEFGFHPERTNNRLPEFQDKGAGFTHDHIATGVLNNDDIGLGKTIETIAAMAILDPRAVKLVLCPAFLKTQWKSEIETWAPKFLEECPTKVAVLWPPSDARSKIPIDMSMVTWLIAFYLDAERAVDAIESRPYFLVIDEIHNVRGYRTQRLNAVTGATRFAAGRVGLTGSLLYNDAARLHPILDLISPGGWGNYSAFAVRYASGIQGTFGLTTGALSNEAELRERLSYCSFRRTREEVADQLPFEAKYQTLWIDAPSVKRGLGFAFRSQAGLISHVRAVAEAKILPLKEQIENDIAAGIPSITFTWMKEHAAAIAKAVGPAAFCVTGDIPAKHRLQLVDDYVRRCLSRDDWIRPLTPSLVCTMDSLGEGANLQWAKAVNLASLDYTPDKIRQALGRALRMGQLGTVPVRIFAVRGSVDEHYVSILRRKLTEQFKLDGREEKSKVDLFTALGGKETQRVLEAMYERFSKEERD